MASLIAMFFLNKALLAFRVYEGSPQFGKNGYKNNPCLKVILSNISLTFG